MSSRKISFEAILNAKIVSFIIVFFVVYIFSIVAIPVKVTAANGFGPAIINRPILDEEVTAWEDTIDINWVAGQTCAYAFDTSGDTDSSDGWTELDCTQNGSDIPAPSSGAHALYVATWGLPDFGGGTVDIATLANFTYTVADIYAAPVDVGDADCSDEANACDFQQALDDAAEVDAIIHLEAGTYLGSGFLYSNSTFGNRLTIMGAGSDTTIISTDDDSDTLEINTAGDVFIMGVAFYDAEGDNSAGLYFSLVRNADVGESVFEGNGYTGLYFEGATVAGSLSIHDNEFIHNTASESGAGAYIYVSPDEGEAYPITVDDNVFSGNYTTDGYTGGALYIESNYVPDVPDDSPVAVTNNQFIDNYSDENSAGAMYVSMNVVSLEISGNTFTDNYIDGSGGNNGGALVVDVYDSASLDLSDNTFDSNYGDGGGYGGGAYIQIEGDANDSSITGNSFTGNGGVDYGGAMYLTVNCECEVLVDSNYMNDNEALYGGGGAYMEFYGNISQNQISNNIVVNNDVGNGSGEAYGGGLDFYISAGSLLSLFNNTITNNQVNGLFEDASGGGMYSYTESDATLTLANNIIVGNNSTFQGEDIFLENDDWSGAGIYSNIFYDIWVSDHFTAQVLANEGADLTDLEGINSFNQAGNIFVDIPDTVAVFASGVDCEDEEDVCPEQFNISSYSVAFDAGNGEVDLDYDFAGNDRVINEVIDIGAWELDTTDFYTAEYWNLAEEDIGVSPDFPETEPDLTRLDQYINFDWGGVSPDDVINDEGFVGRWTKTADLEAGSYAFTVQSDDGNRVYFDDELIIDCWVDVCGDTVLQNVSAGEHDIVVEFYENGGGASITFSYVKAFSEGDGTTEDPFVISSCDDLQNMDLFLESDYVLGDDIDCSETATWNREDFENWYFEYANDTDTTYYLPSTDIIEDSLTIYLDGIGEIDPVDYTVDYENGTITFDEAPSDRWIIADFSLYEGFEPIGDTDDRFAGNLDGQGFTISNLNIHRFDYDFVGLFSVIDQGSTVSDLGLEDADVGGYEYVGGIAGGLSGRLTNVYSTGRVRGQGYVGGLVGTHDEPGGIGGSSPLVYTWNGDKYTYVADVGRGIPRNVVGDDAVPIDDTDITPKDGTYSMKISQEYNEIVYYDELALQTFDHEPGYQVVTSLERSKRDDFFTIADEPSNPLESCTDMYGNDCTEDLSAFDDRWSYRNSSNLNYWTMDFGDLSGEDNIQLVIKGARDFSLKSGDTMRYIQVKDAEGNWVNAFSSSAISSPGGTPTTRVVDLTDKFLTDDYEVRVAFDRTRVNYFAIDTSSPVSYTENTYHPTSVNLGFHGYSAIDKQFYWKHDYDRVSPTPLDIFAPQNGNFTRYGDVTPLLDSTDDQFVVMHHGDEMDVTFDYVPVEDGLERSYVLYNWATFKHADMGPVGQTVDPLPFNGMTEYPYVDPEAYPMTPENEAYLDTWNTRVINDPIKSSGSTIIESYSEADVYGDYNDNIGGLVGYNNKLIRDSYATGDVYITDDADEVWYVGGFVGYNDEGTIVRSYATGDVYDGSDVGGFVGNNDSGAISQSYSTGDVEGLENVGGFAGESGDGGGTITDAYARGSVTGGDQVGSFVGVLYGNIQNVYGTGEVNSEDSFGGLAGEISNGQATHSFWDLETTGIEQADDTTGGRYAKTTDEMMDQDTFTGTTSPYNLVDDSGDHTYQYIRWDITSMKDSVETKASEFNLTLDGANIIWPETTTVTNTDGVFGVGEEPSNLIDGNILTGWHDTAFNDNEGHSVLIFDAGESQTVTFDGYTWSTLDDEDMDPFQWTVSGSDDGEVWDSLDNRSEYVTSSRNTDVTAVDPWDFANIWGKDNDENDGYPYLRMNSNDVAILVVTSVNNDQNHDYLDRNNFNYDFISAGEFADASVNFFKNYDIIIFEPENDYEALRDGLENLEEAMEDEEIVVSIRVAGNDGDQDNIDFLGTDFCQCDYNDDTEILVDADSRFLTGEGIDGIALDDSHFLNWSSTDHGWLENTPDDAPGYNVILENTNGPTWIEYAQGQGWVLLDTLTAIDGGWGGGNDDVADNYIKYLNYLSSNIPDAADVCPNIDGTQTTVPRGKHINGSGNCVSSSGGGGGSSSGGGKDIVPETPKTPSDPLNPSDCLPGYNFSPTTGAKCSGTTTSPSSVAPDASPSGCQITNTLKFGSTGDEVKCLQTKLLVLVDGIFGSQTKAGVMDFQKNHPPLEVDGIVGPKTRAVLNSI